MEQKRRRKPNVMQAEERRYLPEFLVIALVLHLVGISQIDWRGDSSPRPKPEKRAKIVALNGPAVRLSKLQGEARRAAERRQAERRKERDKEKEKNDQPAGRTVDIAPGPETDAPDNARWASEHNTRTERETRSRHTDRYDNVLNEPSVTRKSSASAPQSTPQRTALEIGEDRAGADADKKAGKGPAAFELPSLVRRDTLALKLDPELGKHANQSGTEALQGNSNRLKLSLGDSDESSDRASAPKQGPTMAELVPQVGVMAQISGGPRNDLPDDTNLEEGEGTFLNTREFRFASYFNRMKRDISNQWHPIPELRRRDPSGNIYGSRSRITVVEVVLGEDGSLKDVEVTRSSGVDFLDYEAIAAFKRAKTFPNPPRALADADGIIRFPFAFHIDFRRGAGPLPF